MSSAKAWFPASQWDTRFSAKQKKVYETGWVQTIIYIPDNVMSRVFCYSWKQDEEIHPACVMTLSSGTYRMDILNGEAQNWRSGSDSAENDLGRIWDQIMTGNLNVRPELDIALVTADLLDKIPEGIVNYIGVTEGPVADQ